MKLFKKEPIITFKCSRELYDVIPPPIPAKDTIPTWFRKTTNTIVTSNVTKTRKSVKKCVPFKDAMTMGYVIPLWVDVHVANDGLNLNLTCGDVGFDVFGRHAAEQLGGCPLRKEPYGEHILKFINPWTITTPPGWSCMFIQPINHFDSKLQIITGVVDTDKYKSPVHFPFMWMDKNFNGVIPQGTPLVQVIPFKRTEWTSHVGPQSYDDTLTSLKIQTMVNTVFNNAYRLNWWSPKRYK